MHLKYLIFSTLNSNIDIYKHTDFFPSYQNSVLHKPHYFGFIYKGNINDATAVYPYW